MSGALRNAPCSCGSGKKYKKCCLPKEAAARPLTFSLEVRSRASQALMDFSRRPEFKAERTLKSMMFFGPDFDSLDQDDREGILDQDNVFPAFVEWWFFDSQLNDEPQTFVDRFLARHGVSLRAPERRYLEAMRDSRFSLFEIASITLDVGMTLRDCYSGDAVEVRESRFTHDASPREIVALRVRLDPDGTHVIDGAGFRGFSHRDKDEIVADLREECTAATSDGGNPKEFSNNYGPIIAQQYIYEILLRPMPQLTTTSGDPMLFCKGIFDVVDEPALRAALEAVRQISAEHDGSYTWVRGKDKIVHAVFRIDGTRLTVETTSLRRADAARQLLEQRAAAAVRYRATETMDPMQALASHGATGAPERGVEADDQFPPELQRELVAKYYEKHYRNWIDETIPALEGRTPREAAGDPRLRPVLIGLIKELEVAGHRDRRAGNHGYDPSWMWNELGIDPSER
jgi:hypothetical protein